MYLAIDIGGTKTLLAVFDNAGNVTEEQKFETPKDYEGFLKVLGKTAEQLDKKNFGTVGLALPGKLDRTNGNLLGAGNMNWGTNVPVTQDINRLFGTPTVSDNDANLAGLSEAINIINDYKKVLYFTISTGIGTGFIVNGVIEPNLADSEGGHIRFPRESGFEKWESFASGKAIVARYGKRASEIEDAEIWKDIAHDISLGLFANCAVLQPEAVVIGGGVGTHFHKFEEPLVEAMKALETEVVKSPRILQAKRPEEAVVYGCYELAKAHNDKQ